ncbi:probable RNA-binding protein 19 [Vombatus ursinus]|uniref:probable RNA-binding protein 19 n=1 Tax=Vombatus ursinus TaxID=29139 RepID=UPI000FFD4AFC|nr:probable RNA-binding protein 19 [Vombatus ursinus]
MSRLIVKNLPSGMKEERFRQLFSAFGTLTDCSLKFTKDGKFRKFGFIGFKSAEEAQSALDHFHKSFIDTSRVMVEFCKSFGDPSKPRAWSKHSQKTTQPGKLEESPVASETQKDKKKKKATGELEKLKKDAEFQEFLMVHQKRTQVATWANDTVGVEPKKGKAKRDDDYLNFDSDSGQESEEEIDDEDSEKESPEAKAAEQKELSDMDYLKSKVVRADSSEEEESEDEMMACEEEEQLTPGPRGSERPREKGDATAGGTRPAAAKGEVMKLATHPEPATAYTVKLRGAPFNVTEQNVREFLVPLKPVAIRIVRNAHGNKTGYVFVDFSSEGDVEKALRHNREYMGGRYIEVFREQGSRVTPKRQKDNKKAWQGRQLKEGEEEEELAESGRLFVRNLPYTSTEEDLEEMFARFGPLSEVHYPIDGLTKKPKGFAFITYMFPEHAVKAYAEVDGQVFQGRMLHVLPSTIKKETSEGADATSSSYKKKKALKDKASSSSSHNWNTLFMGTNAVAEAVAQKYNATKSQVFDHFHGSCSQRRLPREDAVPQDGWGSVGSQGQQVPSQISAGAADRQKVKRPHQEPATHSWCLYLKPLLPASSPAPAD